ncbi:hypothetical protein Herbaro_05975 [Herbaspirillum sp. WKF16]|uniref:hypothetical protein n=1 Tax=Herbaspirillum sp. WKF16 TaxID=3028312 RepID=UPI0023A9691D|nr:hypothetical protein [Herbaspirillum sp. WKF16]WDZ97335.1 hypothetical protein Herbaro_05975 [Herbaspirillum sp. WKF16]
MSPILDSEEEKMENNHDKFNYYVGCIFAILQGTFPRRTRIDTVAMLGAEQCEETFDHGRYTGKYRRDGEIVDLIEELEFIYETAHWLFQTGYLIGNVSVTQIGRSIFVTLSPMALEVLKIVPDSIDATPAAESFGTKISKAVKAAATKQVGDVTSQALSYAVKLGWNSITN